MADATLIAKDDMHDHPPSWHELWKADPMPVKVVLASFPKNTAHGQAFIDSMMHRDKILTPVVDLSPVLNGAPLAMPIGERVCVRWTRRSNSTNGP
jgi:hypothetical protein